MTTLILTTLFCAIIGAIVGSLISMMSYRLPIMLYQVPKQGFNLFLPRSHCPHCQHTIPFYRNIPIISYVLNSNCAHCQQTIAKRYLYIELVSAAVGGFIAWRWGLSLDAMAIAWLTFLALLLSVIDWETFFLPDPLVYLLLWSGLLLNQQGILHAGLSFAVWGAVVGYGALWSIEKIYALLRKKQGLGRGDAKLVAAWGACLGWQALPNLILIAALSALIFAAALALKERTLDWQTPIAFGPWLCISAFVLLILTH